MKQIRLPEEYILRLEMENMPCVELLCTKEHLQELVVGYLFNEQIIQDLDDLEALDIVEMNGTGIAKIKIKVPLAENNTVIRTSGLGGIGFHNLLEIPTIEKNIQMTQTEILVCANEMKKHTLKYQDSGGMHCSAIFENGNMLAMFEDIGRHNTLDKLVGDCILSHKYMENVLVITTGRISSDMVKKAANLHAAAIASFSTPTMEAYDIAKTAGMILVGYLERSMMVYCGAGSLRAM